MALDADEQSRERHAVVPHREARVALPGDLRVGDEEGAVAAIDHEEALRDPDLRRGDGPAEAAAVAEVVERSPKGAHLALELRVVNVEDRHGPRAKPRVAKLENRGRDPLEAHELNV